VTVIIVTVTRGTAASVDTDQEIEPQPGARAATFFGAVNPGRADRTRKKLHTESSSGYLFWDGVKPESLKMRLPDTARWFRDVVNAFS